LLNSSLMPDVGSPGSVPYQKSPLHLIFLKNPPGLLEKLFQFPVIDLIWKKPPELSVRIHKFRHCSSDIKSSLDQSRWFHWQWPASSPDSIWNDTEINQRIWRRAMAAAEWLNWIYDVTFYYCSKIPTTLELMLSLYLWYNRVVLVCGSNLKRHQFRISFNIISLLPFEQEEFLLLDNNNKSDDNNNMSGGGGEAYKCYSRKNFGFLLRMKASRSAIFDLPSQIAECGCAGKPWRFHLWIDISCPTRLSPASCRRGKFFEEFLYERFEYELWPLVSID